MAMKDRFETDELEFVEPFVFHSSEVLKHVMGVSPDLTFGVGDRTMTVKSCHWSHDLEKIRHQLEGYTFFHETFLTFESFEAEVEIRLKQVTEYWPKMVLCRVEVERKKSTDEQMIVGYCEEKQTLLTIYESLLRFSAHQPEELPEDDEEWRYWLGPDRLTAYNQVKSPILEHYFTSDEYYCREACMERQVHIKRALTLVLDHYGFMIDDRDYLFMYDDLQELCGRPEVEGECYMSAPGFEEWKDVQPDSATVADILEKGRRLADIVREHLPKEYDLWMETPYLREGKIVLEYHLYPEL